MIGKASNSGIRPVALGTTVNSSTYGQTIPVYYGRTKGGLYLIWEANIRQTGSKKGGKKKGKKGAPTYAANVDFLIGHNPILTPLQFWANQSQRLPLNFAVQRGGGLTVTDPNFYAVIAVTAPQGHAPITFNDYGDPNGSTTIPAGNWEIPLWNSAFTGPDPTWPTAYRQGCSYYWTPEMGNTIRINNFPIFTSSVNIYYAQLWNGGSAQYGKKQSGTDIPAAALHLTFEPILGDGPEYSGRDSSSGIALASQQIFYPCYAGLGSPNFQTGQTGLPEVQAEILGSFAINPQGDADFPDMIEDVLKQGLSQPGYATVTDPLSLQTINTHQIQRGLNCFHYPGPVQMMQSGNVDPFLIAGTNPFIFSLPNAAGNFLVALAASDIVAGLVPNWQISDTAGNVWKPLFSSPGPVQAWYAAAKAAPAGNTVNLSGFGYNWEALVMEIGGVDTLDAVVTPGATNTVGGTCSLAGPGQPAYLLAAGLWRNFFVGNPGIVPAWNLKTSQSQHISVYDRRVYAPGTFSVTIPGVFPFFTPTESVLFIFKNSQPVAYPQALGDILDDATMQLTRAQCKANGLWGSLCMDSQQKGSDWLEGLYKAANAAPVWSGFKLKSIPRSEVSFAGNGAVYNAPTASGPTVLSISDFIADPSKPLYEVRRKAQVDVPNLLQIQFPNRSSDYNDVVVSQPLTAAIALFGSRKDSPEQMRMIQDPAVARRILDIEIRKEALRNSYTFQLNASRKLLEPMDLVRLPADPLTGTSAVDVRLTCIEEDEADALKCEAEPFIYGTYAPQLLPADVPLPYQPQSGATAANINPPIFFEPVPRLIGAQNQGQVWIVVSAPPGQLVTVTVLNGGSGYAVNDVLGLAQTGASGGQVTVAAVNGGVITAVTVRAPGKGYVVASSLSPSGGHGSGALLNIAQVSAMYGGCFVYISTDGGNSYNQAGQIAGNGTTGITTADWPVATDPDSTNNLLLDMSESGEPLDSYQNVDEDNFTFPCYVAGGTSCIPYELMTYAVATLTASNQYTLEATPSGDHLRRSVFGAPTPGAGVDHTIGSRFAFLGPTGTGQEAGILKLDLDPRWVGVTLYFKFLSVNTFGGGMQSLSSVPAYSYTPTGVAQQSNPSGTSYVQTPASALSSGSAGSISMAAVTVQFPSGTVKYYGRSFTVPDPATPTWYYVTVADPKFLGDPSATSLLTAQCQTSQQYVGLPGYTYVGAILLKPGGGASAVTPGGWPQQTQVGIAG